MLWLPTRYSPFATRTLSRSRDAWRPGFETFLCHPTRGGGAPRRRSGAAAPAACLDAARQALARRLIVPQRGDARLSALHRGDFRPGPVLPSPAFPPDPCSDAPRGQVVVPGGRGPGPPGADGYEPPPRDATPHSANGTVSGDAPR